MIGLILLAAVEIESAAIAEIDPPLAAIAAVEDARPAFWFCADAAHQRRPLPPRTEAVLALQLDAEGRVQRASATIKPHRADLAPCMRLAARQIDLPPLNRRIVRVRLIITAPQPD